MSGRVAWFWRLGQRDSGGTQKTRSAVYSSRLSSRASSCLPLRPSFSSSALSRSRRSSKESEMYLRKSRPRTTCLYSAASTCPRRESADFQRVSAKSRSVAVEGWFVGAWVIGVALSVRERSLASGVRAARHHIEPPQHRDGDAEDISVARVSDPRWRVGLVEGARCRASTMSPDSRTSRPITLPRPFPPPDKTCGPSSQTGIGGRWRGAHRYRPTFFHVGRAISGGRAQGFFQACRNFGHARRVCSAACAAGPWWGARLDQQGGCSSCVRAGFWNC